MFSLLETNGNRMLSAFFHVPCSNSSAQPSTSIHVLFHQPHGQVPGEDTVPKQSQLTPGTGLMPPSPLNLKLLNFTLLPRTCFLFLSPLRPLSSLPLTSCPVAFFLMAKTNSCRPAALIYKHSLNAKAPWTIISLQFTGTFKALWNIFST